MTPEGMDPALAALVDEIRPRDAAHVLWVFDGGRESEGLQPGRFTTYIIQAAGCGDSENRERLREAFPGPVSAAIAYLSTEGGRDFLRALALADRG